jgi:excisionase family DNA binding protein
MAVLTIPRPDPTPLPPQRPPIPVVPMERPTPAVLSAAQVARLLDVDEQAVLELAQAGELPARRIGDAWRFSRDAVLAWLGARPQE